MKSETRRLNKLKDAPKNEAKRYKVPSEAVEIIRRAGKIHAQQSRAIQIGIELLWRTPGALAIPDNILTSPLTSYTYKLPPRTAGLIEELAKDYGTKGQGLSACAAILSAPEPRRGAFK
ncbi:MAG TPA: hypothetical protein VF840_04505 [Terriglobales bacterium]